MRSAQTFWRNHAKPRLTSRRAVVVRKDVAQGTADHVRQLMKQAVQSSQAAGFPRPLFPFEASDVAAIYTHKKDEGDGLWFGLIDGRVYSATGEPSASDPDAYVEAAA